MFFPRKFTPHRMLFSPTEKRTVKVGKAAQVGPVALSVVLEWDDAGGWLAHGQSGPVSCCAFACRVAPFLLYPLASCLSPSLLITHFYPPCFSLALNVLTRPPSPPSLSSPSPACIFHLYISCICICASVLTHRSFSIGIMTKSPVTPTRFRMTFSEKGEPQIEELPSLCWMVRLSLAKFFLLSIISCNRSCLNIGQNHQTPNTLIAHYFLQQ